MIESGRIDIHCHLLYGIDDGCQSFAETLECIERLKRAGYVGSICTPHVWPTNYPDNTPTNIDRGVASLNEELRAAGVDYQLWSGGEVRIAKESVTWMKAHGVPTLADSRCVLLDIWEAKWPRWFDKTVDWLMEEGYQPILAHPERSQCTATNPKKLIAMADRGVWLQGNFRAMTGEDGYQADRMVRELLQNGAYKLMALDLHSPICLESRLDGLQLVAMEFGDEAVEALTVRNVRELVFG